ncbi:Presequence protease 1, chloroplastic/mitochondrial [Gracilariopsis chorda]|uniref:Presequence protease 1, chloroplastic/mitochondrial n=1 Tax=Gracilariopsis chorda TaxID=448386 RepID=A0A2V3IDB3_9FLOR|nr:Presequence protease 1, chloroplastic/mitochondrial [Gracilariopsis chorda]|eukprot:PXF40041.1 Presequence protease 1, chloroplastic/mitochondrial [Gracilariopsis chorda]
MTKLLSTAYSAFIAAAPRSLYNAHAFSKSILRSRSSWAGTRLPLRHRLSPTTPRVLQNRSVFAMATTVTEFDTSIDCKVGEVVSGFRLHREEFVKEISSMVRFWIHEKTGARLISVLNDDENKTFGVVFRTPPNDSTGVAHILEHSVLCGSKKYPVKEPFVELMKGSLNTFLNAFTYPDKTCYPVASCNERDFYNLVDVYMDAVFHPILTPDTLAQEGHHLELDDPEGKVAIKGVVYNEMKGAYSSADRVLAELSQRMLFPDTVYGFESGGHPRAIPNLTWENFKAFYDDYYHPSNARMWFYGDDDEGKRLAKANSVLKDFDRREVSSTVGLQKPWTEPKSFQFDYDAGSGPDIAKKYMATVNWLINTPVDEIEPSELLSLTVLNHILLSLSSSPLRKALTDSQLGEDVVGGGLETDLRQMSFSVGLKGMTEESAPKMEKVIFDVLMNVEKNGFPERMIDASLNTIEFRLRENNTGSFPKGLALMLRSLTTWLHDADPLTTLRFEAAVKDLRDRLDRKEPVFQETVTKYLLNNPHRASVTLKPDPEFSKKEDAAEQARINKAVAGFTADDYEQVVSETRRLKEKQAAHDRPEDLAKIPTLRRGDLDKEVKTVAFDKYQEKGVTVFHHPLSTNGVVYVDMALDMSQIPQEYLPLASIFVGSLTELGTSKDDFVALQQKLGAETGGVSTSVYSSQMYAPDGNGPALMKLLVRGKAVVSQVSHLMELVGDILTDANIDNKERFRQLLIEERAGIESALSSSGHTVAGGRLGAMFRPALWADEQLGGIDFLKAIRKLIARVDDNWDSVVAELRQLQKLMMSRENMVINVTTAASDFGSVKPLLTSFFDRLPEKPESFGSSWISTFSLLPRANEGLIVPSTVNYVGKAANLYDLGFKLNGGHSVASRHLGTSYLWDTVRVQGGAYGGFCRMDVKSGMFMYLSYRDPNIDATLKSYDGAPEFLSSLKLSNDELSRSVIGMIGAMDSYQLPDTKGFASTLRQIVGETDEVRQQRRDEVLSVSTKDFKQLGEALQAVRENGTVVVVGGEDALKKAVDDGVDLSLEVIV